MDVIPSSHLDLLQKPAFAHIATLRRDGSPQTCPVWFEWDGTWLKMTNVKTRLRYRNIRRDPRVALSILDPENPYRYLELRGVVERVEDDPEFAFYQHLQRRYDFVHPRYTPQAGEPRVVEYMRPVVAHTIG